MLPVLCREATRSWGEGKKFGVDYSGVVVERGPGTQSRFDADAARTNGRV